MTKLLVIDDHDVVRQGLTSALLAQGFAMIETASTVKEARSKVAVFNPDALIVDIYLPDGSGLEIVSWARKLSQSIAIVVLSMNEAAIYSHPANMAGANAYLSKNQSVLEITSAIKFAIAHPQSFVSNFAHSDHEIAPLTARELDVLHLLVKGLTNTEISRTLFISLSTAKTHISSILRKLSSTNRTAAIQAAKEKGLLL